MSVTLQAIFVAVSLVLYVSRAVSAQDHQHPAPAAEATSWHVMQEAVAFGLFNHQGGPRGGDEVRVPNWWMGMFSRPVGRSRLTLNTMFSVDPLTVGKKGYRHLFQVGESYEGRPLVDYQHPHDLFMQLAAVWRVPIGAETGLTIAGGPAAEPALGPVAFMHRASAIENPVSPLAHHTLDSTHIAFGVIAAGIDRGPWTIEGSLFNGREPDDDRWDFDLGALDSFSGRVWYKPSERWEFQASSGRLREPEELGHGNLVRTTASLSWLNVDGENFAAVTAAVGVNNGDEATRAAFLVEGTRHMGVYSLYGRLEVVEVETGVLAGDHAISHAAKNTLTALTIGGVRDLGRWSRFDYGVGGAVSLYGVPGPLEDTHGERPVSFQVFLRIRPSVKASDRMWNMRMTRPMPTAPADPHAGH
jgi:hypothetical protein